MRPPIIILAGGKGTRLGEITKTLPKPMVDVCGKPFIHRLIQHYISQGFTEFHISVGYRSDVLVSYLRNSRLNLYPVVFIFYDDPWAWGASQAALNILEKIQHAWVVNGDTWIPESLPETEGKTTVLTLLDVDAGAQYRAHAGYHPIQIKEVSNFFDIGTPFGLGSFRSYFKREYPDAS